MNNSLTDSMDSPKLGVVFCTAFGILMGLLIIAGNILSIAVTRRMSNLADSTKILMTSLAVSDLTVGFLVVFTVVASAIHRRPFGDVVCHIIAILPAIALLLSMISLISLNVERYIAITRPYKFPVWCSRRRVITSVIVASIGAACFQIAILYLFQVPVKYFEGAALCFYDNVSTEFNILLLLFYDVVPVFIMMCIYYRIIQISREHQKRINDSSPNDQNNIQDNKAVKTFIIVTLTFAVCFTPFLITRVIEGYTKEEVAEWLQFVFSWLIISNSACNVFIYCLFNRSYRQRAKKILTDRFPCCKRSVAPVDIQA